MPRLVLQDGAVFADRYEIVRCIRAGGMGAIYEVIHQPTKKRRALKVMLPEVVENEDLRKRFKLEATVTAAIESEHVVETFDAGIDDETGAPFLVMELLKGIDLKNHLRKRDHLSFEETLYVLNQVAMGLERTHGANIVHRDLKPENLFLTRRDDGAVRVKILDFGIAKVVATATQTSKTKVMGTPLYMSPEQINGDGNIGPAADLYALAHIAFTLLVGRPYWEEDANEIEGVFGFLLRLMEGIEVSATQRSKQYGVELPEAFDAWFERAVAPKASDRFASARAQIDALADALDRCIPTPVEMSGDFTAAFGLDPIEDRLEMPKKSPAGHPHRGRSDGDATDERSPTRLDAALDTRAIREANARVDSPAPRPTARLMLLAGVAVLLVVGIAVATLGGDPGTGTPLASEEMGAKSPAATSAARASTSSIPPPRAPSSEAAPSPSGATPPGSADARTPRTRPAAKQSQPRAPSTTVDPLKVR